jgi:predicted nucleic acid-binding protein
MSLEPLGNAILQESEALLLKHAKTNGLRTLDALHLATFILIKEDDWTFVASDDNLIALAKAIGASTINPLTHIL